jgi:hypothetical protein
VAGHVRFELRNVVANYPFEKSHRFEGIQPNSGHGDHSRLSCSGRFDQRPEARRRLPPAQRVVAREALDKVISGSPGGLIGYSLSQIEGVM